MRANAQTRHAQVSSVCWASSRSSLQEILPAIYEAPLSKSARRLGAHLTGYFFCEAVSKYIAFLRSLLVSLEEEGICQSSVKAY
jgi:hypothetical protein